MQWLKKIIKARAAIRASCSNDPPRGTRGRFIASNYRATITPLIRPPILLIVPWNKYSLSSTLFPLYPALISSLPRYSRFSFLRSSTGDFVTDSIQRAGVLGENRSNRSRSNFSPNSAKSICLMRKSAVYCHAELALRLRNHKWSTSAKSWASGAGTGRGNSWKLSRILTRSKTPRSLSLPSSSDTRPRTFEMFWKWLNRSIFKLWGANTFAIARARKIGRRGGFDFATFTFPLANEKISKPEDNCRL